MKTVYKFGFKLHENTDYWIPQLSRFFNHEFKAVELINQYPNREKNWYESFYKLEELNKPRMFCSNKLEKTVLGFNRYQEYVYMTLIFEGVIEDLSSTIGFIKEHVSGFVDNFIIPFKEPDLYADYCDKEKYHENLTLSNPVYMNSSDDFECLNSYKNRKTEYSVHKEDTFTIKYSFEYLNQKNSNYERNFKQLFILENTEALDNAIKHFQSVFILFHRSFCHYNELLKIDKSSEVMVIISDKLNEVWPIERINLFLINRFLNANLYNQTFYSVLELNAQMNTIFSQLKITYQKIEDKYEKQYERVKHNFSQDCRNDDQYFTELLNYLNNPSVHRKRLLERINDFFEPTDAQVERLRSDNDSKVNFAIQWIMSILSVIIFLWGISTFWYQGIMTVSSPIIDPISTYLPWIPVKMLALVCITVLSAVVFVFFFLIHNSSLATKEMKKVIRSRQLELKVLEDKILEINKINHKIKRSSKSPKPNKKRLLKITETFKLVTTHIIMNIDYDKDEIQEELLKLTIK